MKNYFSNKKDNIKKDVQDCCDLILVDAEDKKIRHDIAHDEFLMENACIYIGYLDIKNKNQWEESLMKCYPDNYQHILDNCDKWKKEISTECMFFPLEIISNTDTIIQYLYKTSMPYELVRKICNAFYDNK